MTEETSESLMVRVFFAARDGMPITLAQILKERGEEEVKQLIHQEIVDSNNQRFTPLLIAARNGHEDVIKMLLKFNVDLEQVGSICLDDFSIEGASALWCAAGAGHLNIVKLLVKSGADVDHPTLTNSTPLRAACFDGRLDIVTYLVNHSANIHIANKYNNTCLMIACYKGHLDIVSYLLQMGANPNEKALCGATAMHFAAECGHVAIVRELLTFGALITKNEYGMTALTTAAERAQAEVVEFLVKQPEVSLEQKIDALELLGASYANDKDNYCLELTYAYLYKTMLLRFKDPNRTVPKPKVAPVAAYGHWVECQNMQELKAIENDRNALHMESLTIRERILGVENPEVPHSVIFRGAVFADSARFDRCLDLWNHALYLSQLNHSSVVKDLLRFAQVFSQIVHVGVELQFPYVQFVLQATIKELQRIIDAIACPGPKDDILQLKGEMDCNVITALYFLVIITKVIKGYDIDDVYRLNQLIFELNKMKITSRSGESLLHLCVSAETPVDSFHTKDVVKFPCSATTKLLIECGADVNAMDHLRNTPLHIIVCYQKPVSDFMTLHAIIVELTEAGAHMDAVNMNGMTPFELTSTGVAEIILRSQSKLNLKCLAARAVQKHTISYKGQVPQSLESFVDLHGPESDCSINEEHQPYGVDSLNNTSVRHINGTI